MREREIKWGREGGSRSLRRKQTRGAPSYLSQQRWQRILKVIPEYAQEAR